MRTTQRRRVKNRTSGGTKKTTTPKKKMTATMKKAELYKDFSERFKKIADAYSPKENKSTGFFDDDRASKVEDLLNEAKKSYNSKKLTKTSFVSLEKKFEGFIDEPYSP